MPAPVKNRTYQGFSTVGNEGIKVMYDSALVAQDLNNVFNMRKGENIVNPAMGSIIWSMQFEQATEANINIMKTDTIAIFQAESRVQLLSLDIVASTDPTVPGYTLNAQVQYIGSQVAQNFTVNFMSSLTDSGI